MKVERKTDWGKVHDLLVAHFKEVLPKSLVVTQISQGYGYNDVIQTVEEWKKIRLFSLPNVLAYIGNTYVELHNPEYFSDIEQALISFESKTGHEITLKVWES